MGLLKGIPTTYKTSCQNQQSYTTGGFPSRFTMGNAVEGGNTVIFVNMDGNPTRQLKGS